MPTLLVAALPPILWMGYFLVVYIFEILGCRFALDGTLIVTVNALFTLATVAAIAVVGWRAGRRLQRLPEGAPDAYLARLSLMLCGTSLVATLWVGLPLLLVPACL